MSLTCRTSKAQLTLVLHSSMEGAAGIPLETQSLITIKPGGPHSQPVLANMLTSVSFQWNTPLASSRVVSKLQNPATEWTASTIFMYIANVYPWILIYEDIKLNSQEVIAVPGLLKFAVGSNSTIWVATVWGTCDIASPSATTVHSTLSHPCATSSGRLDWWKKWSFLTDAHNY